MLADKTLISLVGILFRQLMDESSDTDRSSSISQWEVTIKKNTKQVVVQQYERA